MMKVQASLVLVASAIFGNVLGATAGCGKTPTNIKAGVNTVTVNGKTREWTLTLPENYDNTKPHRLIFGLHWLGGTMNDVVNGPAIQPYYGLPELVNSSTIFVAPNGLRAQIGTGWENKDGEDIAFMKEIVKATNENLCINEKLRFSMGFSYGAAMSYAIACELYQDFRAVAALSGGTMSGCVGGTNPVAYYGQHGISDTVLPLSLGKQIRDTFVRNNGCAAENTPDPAPGSKSHLVTKYSGCAADKPVWWTSFDGGHTATPADGGTNKNTTFTHPQVWEFFSQFT
ncbi:alpha/beta-hydrolase [Corynespora cassiicola Philippines]|uniref:Feruloyl esterase C n=1 Tax=Corynespora cassiicola Philippines TaxID=1448308 RepID=A0A2T2N3A1_CORCC|nr:alpha/beta-hydrolase [Corynespora cassiicola Philippines]